jgi:hypothetical protein
MTLADLTKITHPEDLFEGDLDKAKAKYRELAKQWHPDVNKDPSAPLAFQHINTLYDQAVEKIEKGTWRGKSVLKFLSEHGQTYEIKYLVSHPFELGQMYVGDTHVTYIIEKQYKDLVEYSQNAYKFFKFGDDKMKNEITRYLPIGVQGLTGVDGRILQKMTKTPDLLLLRDVLNHFGGKIDPKHAAWIGSSLHNLAAYMNYTGLVHHDISPDTYFISPEHHSGALLGGWWYCRAKGSALTHLPVRTMDFLPWKVQVEKKASVQTDQELIRATVRELLGDVHGTTLKDPKEMVEWLKLPSGKDPVANYKDWYEVLQRTFGKRRFTELKLTAADLYRR